MRHVGEEFEYILAELLPLAPTAQRSMEMVTAYDSATRLYTITAINYPGAGVDSYWQVVISDDVTTATPVVQYKMVAHPDATPGNPGSMKLVRVMNHPSGQTMVLFDDGSLHTIDVGTATTYTKIGNIKDSSSGIEAIQMTRAHVVDGTNLKSILMNERKQSYLVVSDLTAVPAKVSAPLLLKEIPGEPGSESPISAHMMYSGPNTEAKLGLIVAGNFDQIVFVDETTGEQSPIINSLTDQPYPAVLECYESTKDCDGWTTSTYDPVSGVLYFQAHAVDSSSETTTTAVYGVQWVENHITKTWFPVINMLVWPMSFGFMGYQYVAFK